MFTSCRYLGYQDLKPKSLVVSYFRPYNVDLERFTVDQAQKIFTLSWIISTFPV